MRTRLSLFIWILLSVGSTGVFAGEGGGHTGGGDPRVAEFLGAAKSVCRWLDQVPDSSLKKFGVPCSKELTDLEDSVNKPYRVARISSTSNPLIDNDVPKDALTHLDSRTIEININRWQSETMLEHQMTASMEMALLLGIPNRYNLGQLLLSDAGSPILGFMGQSVVSASQSWSGVVPIPGKGEVVCFAMPKSGGRPTPLLMKEANNYEISDMVSDTQVVVAMNGNLELKVIPPGGRGSINIKGIHVNPLHDSPWAPPLSKLADRVFESDDIEIFCGIGN